VIRLEYELFLSAALFVVGLYGVLTRKNGIVVLMSVEIILNAAIMNFVAFSSYYGAASGQAFALLAIALSAAEAAIGLAIFLNLYKTHRSVEVDVASMLRG
jgi:NADH-quinone oxidoreductase subunit K